ncbi:MAG: GGDEF domain-containing protein [Bdellovibrionaceae bacterium]|nr:GGDEF domain-containing protein [Pseudobdellovibrionaceae bacterium]
MDIRAAAPQFTVYVFANDIDRGAGIKVALGAAGYDAFFFEERERLLSRIAEKAPHLLIFPTSSLVGQLSGFVESFLKANAEIRWICLAQPSELEGLSAYNEYGLVDLVTDQSEGLLSRVTFAVDRVCERLYLQYQNEQLFDENARLKAELRGRQERLNELEKKTQQKGVPLGTRVRDYLSAESQEDLLRRFMANLPSAPCVYFKFLPGVQSLVVTHSSGLDPSRLKGVGVKLTDAEMRDFGTQVSLGMVVPSLGAMLNQAFQFNRPRLLPLFVRGQLEGLVAHAGDLPTETKDLIGDEFSLMGLAYLQFTLEKRVDVLEVQDPVTELYNARFYRTRLSEEWSRARRSKQPLCLVKIALDDFFELEQTLGEAIRDQLLRNLADLVRRTSRTSDFSARTAQNEITMILPQCNRQGAMIRAERLRRLTESSQMLENGLKVSISLGISEYPSLCSTAENLDATAGKALAHIMGKGGNRLCLFKAPPNHQPEFPVSVEPES